MCKATIIGNAAGGKSTMCKAIAKAHSLPIHSIDKIQWKPNWTPVPQKTIASEIRRIMSNERWLIDGWGPWETIEERFEASDTIIFIDLPIWIHLWWATKRQFKALVAPNSVDQPDGCNLVPMTWKMYQMIWTLHKTARPKLLDLVNRFNSQKVIHHIKTPRELEHFAKEYC